MSALVHVCTHFRRHPNPRVSPASQGQVLRASPTRPRLLPCPHFSARVNAQWPRDRRPSWVTATRGRARHLHFVRGGYYVVTPWAGSASARWRRSRHFLGRRVCEAPVPFAKRPRPPRQLTRRLPPTSLGQALHVGGTASIDHLGKKQRRSAMPHFPYRPRAMVRGVPDSDHLHVKIRHVSLPWLGQVLRLCPAARRCRRRCP